MIVTVGKYTIVIDVSGLSSPEGRRWQGSWIIFDKAPISAHEPLERGTCDKFHSNPIAASADARTEGLRRAQVLFDDDLRQSQHARFPYAGCIVSVRPDRMDNGDWRAHVVVQRQSELTVVGEQLSPFPSFEEAMQAGKEWGRAYADRIDSGRR